MLDASAGPIRAIRAGFLGFFGVVAVAGGVRAQQILETYNDSLTTYLPTSSTRVQDVEPQDLQRGVNLDGSLRSGPMLPMQLAGNPFENAWRGQERQGNLRLDVGSFAPSDVDIALPCTGLSWVVGRTYNSAQLTSGGSNRDSNGYQGKNWFQTSQPEIVLFAGATNDLDVLYLVYGADRFVEFKRQALNSNQFKGKNGAAGCFQKSGSPQTYTYTDQIGNKFVFFGFNATNGDGQLWKMIDPAGNVTFVGDAANATTAQLSGYDGAGRILVAYDGSDRRYSYTYTPDVNSIQRLTRVKCEIKTGGTWASSPTGVSTAVQVDYDYYGSSDSKGDAGNLKRVTVTTRLNESTHETDQQVKKKYYRYWTGTYNPGGSPDVRGYPNSIKYVYEFEGVRRMDLADDSTLNDSYVSTADASLTSYAALYLEYDSSHRVNSAWFNGQCGCGAGSMDGTFAYSFGTNGNVSLTWTSGYDVFWKNRTVIAQPDGTYVTQYFDETGQGLARVTTNADPAGSPGKTWVTNITRDSNGGVIEIDTPANVTGYTHNSSGNPDGTITVDSSVGLVWKIARTSSGTLTAFMTDKTYQSGSGGTAYFDSSATYDTSLSTTLTDVTVVRPLIATTKVYATAVTSGGGNGYTRTYSYTDYSGSSKPLSVESATVAEPAVSTGNNGSNSATGIARHMSLEGKVDYEKLPDLTITYHAYTDGQETTLTEDASSVTSGFSSSGTTLSKTTTRYISKMGFTTAVQPPINNMQSIYQSVLADQRVVRLEFTDFSGGSYYGPVKITVLNQAGRVELSGIVALSGNATSVDDQYFIDETKSDPLTAVATGAIAQMTSYIYDDSGTQLQEERKYFLLPSLPGGGAGTEGTNYDSTRYGYDSMGRRWRLKDATGTITRTVFDALGRTTDSYIGTNDHTFSGGESVNADNMVKTENLVYDGGNGGANSLLTQRTLYVENGTTGQRITSYIYDLRGRRIVDVPPVAPFMVHLYDNMSREVATGQFSSSSGLGASTDPTSTSTNRLALNETYYDEVGRVWKTIRHKINQSNGADSDSLESLNWYDGNGRPVKTKGDQVTKTIYDRVGRITDEYILSKDTDSTYAHAIGITGSEIVLEQHETRYDQTQGTVLMRANISRFHSDVNTGSGETTGKLDTNTDGGTADDLILTAADVKGRPQVTAFWYDSIGREVERVEYGTNGGSTFDRPGTTKPANTTSTALVTVTVFNDDGTVKSIAEPNAMLASPTEKPTTYFYDAEGRRTKDAKNYDVTVNSGSPYGTDQNVTVTYGYSKGLRTTLTAVMPSGGTNQVTKYIYGTTAGTPSQMKISTGNLLRAVKYPDSTNTGTTSGDIDSDSSDVVSFAYNAQGGESYKKDQGGNVIETDLDTLGRTTEKRVTTLGSGFDGAVRRIETAYDALGRADTVAQLDSATVGSGSVVDEVGYEYDDWGNVSKFRQDRNSALAGGGDDYAVSYTWAKATTGRNSVRKTSVTLPSGASYNYNYDSRNGLHDAEASRVTYISSGSTPLVLYNYNGLSQVVGQKYAEPAVQWKEFTSTPGDYADLDRFNRVVKSRWTKNLTTPVDFYHVELSYDANSNIVTAKDSVHTGFDVAYTMDKVNRLTRAEEGTLSGGSITSRTRDEQWTLSHTGNWDVDKVDLNGNDNFSDTGELNDTRTDDTVNQLNSRDIHSDTSVVYGQSYDGPGSLTDDGESYKYVWDAFLRLRKVNNQSNQLVAEYRYNGLGYRIAEHIDTDTDGDVDSSDKWFYDAFDERWRQVARFRESDTSPKEEFLHHQAGIDGLGSSNYIDLVALRNRDANTAWTASSDGVLEERVYYGQNSSFDVSVVINSNGTIREWVGYSSYGIPFGLPIGDTDSDGDCDATDAATIQFWSGGYSATADIDLDGDVDATDYALITTGVTIGRYNLSASNTGNTLGFCGGRRTAAGWNFRTREYSDKLGSWSARDTLAYADGQNLYQYCISMPLIQQDPYGFMAEKGGTKVPPFSVSLTLTGTPSCGGGCKGKTESPNVATVVCTWTSGPPIAPFILKPFFNRDDVTLTSPCPTVSGGFPLYESCTCTGRHPVGSATTTPYSVTVPVDLGLSHGECTVTGSMSTQRWAGTCAMVGWVDYLGY